ncbi:MAG TPA: hypothetical protein V6C58_24340, partial [Allocoleopsis sp.]
SVITAQKIKDALAGMDANAVNELLEKSGQNAEAVAGYNERYEAFAERLIDAAKNITYESERKPIQTMILSLDDYLMRIQRARDFNEQGKTQEVLKTYQEAADIMDDQLLIAADLLDDINFKALEKTYTNYVLSYITIMLLIAISGLFLLVSLIRLQIFLNYKMKRLLNPMLLAASGITLMFLVYVMSALQRSFADIKVAKEDAFTSVHVLRKSRALAYMANADESRYLLDKGNAVNHEKAFFSKIAQIIEFPPGQNFDQVIQTLNQGQKVPGLKGYLADELNNITFPGEKESVLETLRTLKVYVEIDKEIRQLEESGQHSAAIALCTGYQPQQSNWAFEEFKKAHQKTLDLNLNQFEQNIKKGEEELKNFEITTSLVMFLVGVFTLLGLKPRIKEYSD